MKILAWSRPNAINTFCVIWDSKKCNLKLSYDQFSEKLFIRVIWFKKEVSKRVISQKSLRTTVVSEVFSTVISSADCNVVHLLTQWSQSILNILWVLCCYCNSIRSHCIWSKDVCTSNRQSLKGFVIFHGVYSNFLVYLHKVLFNEILFVYSPI